MCVMQAHARKGPVAVAGLEKMLNKVRWLLGEVSLYEKVWKELNRLFTVYSDSEFDSQWGDNAFVARVEQRIAASDSKLLQAEATYFEAATAAERITALESIALKAQTRSLLSTLRYMCVQQEYTAFQRKHIAYLSDLASE